MPPKGLGSAVFSSWYSSSAVANSLSWRSHCDLLRRPSVLSWRNAVVRRCASACDNVTDYRETAIWGRYASSLRRAALRVCDRQDIGVHATPYMRAPATSPVWRGGGLESQTPFDVFTTHDEHTLSGADAMGLTVHHMLGARCLVFHYSEFHRDQLPLSTPAIRHLFPMQ